MIFAFQNSFKNWVFHVFYKTNMKRTFFEKNSLEVSIVSDSELTISSFSKKIILPLETDLSEVKVFAVF